MNNSTLLMVGIIGAVAMLSGGLAVLPTTAMQQASAQGTDFGFEQEQKNKCSGNAECSNEGTITFGEPVMDDLVSFPLNS
jgi:hypothetical protein